MSVKYITGKLGGGKSLIAVGLIRDYLKQGRRVVTNIDLKLELLVGSYAKNVDVIRLPDKPNVDDLEKIGFGHDLDTYDESKNGILVLDELGTWFNARNWNDKERQPIINWLLHARKKRWDCHFIVQDMNIIDKQAREATGEIEISCRDMSKLRIPVVSTLVGYLTGGAVKLKFPKMHVGVEYNHSANPSLVNDRFWYKGKDLYQAYDTQQAFLPRDNIHSVGFTHMLTPWDMFGRHLPQKRTLGYYYQKYLLSPTFTLIALLSLSATIAYASISESKTSYDENNEKKVEALTEYVKTSVAEVRQSEIDKAKSVLLSFSSDETQKTESCNQFDDYRLSGGLWVGSNYNFHISTADGGKMSSRALSQRFTIDVIDSCYVTISDPVTNCSSTLYCRSTVKSPAARSVVGDEPLIENIKELDALSNGNNVTQQQSTPNESIEKNLTTDKPRGLIHSFASKVIPQRKPSVTDNIELNHQSVNDRIEAQHKKVNDTIKQSHQKSRDRLSSDR